MGGRGFYLFFTSLGVGVAALALYAFHSIVIASADSDHTVNIIITLLFGFIYALVYEGYFKGDRAGAIKLGVGTALYNVIMCLSALREIPLWLHSIAFVTYVVVMAPLAKRGIRSFTGRSK